MPIYIEGSEHYYEATKSKKGIKNRNKVYKKKKHKPQFFPELNIAGVIVAVRKKDYHSPKKFFALLKLSSSVIAITQIIFGSLVGWYSVWTAIPTILFSSIIFGGYIAYNMCEYSDYKFRLREWKVNKEFDKLMDNEIEQ